VIRHGDVEAGRAEATTVVSGTYEVGMQDQAFLGPEAGIARPLPEGGVELQVATQWLHVDRAQIAASLGLPEEQVRLVLAGVGGAFGGREDLSMQIHACLLALRCGRPVKMVYGREESFFGHVHRHPARLSYEHGADAEGRLTFISGRVLLDGGAYASSSGPVCLNAATTAAGPYVCDNVLLEGISAYTNNPPCGAMRGFGAVQVCFAYEAQMDLLAARLSIHPVELRRRNALAEGGVMPTGQVLDGPGPVAELLERVRRMPLPPESPAEAERDVRTLPGGASNTTHGEGVRRGVGYAVGFKNVGFSRGHRDYSTARVRVDVGAEGEAVAEVHHAAAEVGQGLITISEQIARSELGVERVVMHRADTQVGDAGSSSASRQSWFTGGAVKAACEAVREILLERARTELGSAAGAGALSLRNGWITDADGEAVASLAELVAEEGAEATREFHGRPTHDLDADGQGDTHMAFAFAAHRAVVDVDVELGLVRVVEIATAQDVGKALNPLAVEGQIEGGIAQGLGLALMEEVQLSEGKVRNPSFTDYLIPTILDMPPVRMEVLELPQPLAPYGLNGIGEPPTIASTPAILAALRDATGRKLPRVPVTPDALIGLGGEGG
jgi:xanthine dehydrogenase D subunit